MKEFPVPADDRLITTWDKGEDAALWKIDEKRVGILTLDFITPVVDDAGEWGEIAAANAISDVFAMGGKPFLALNIVAFPVNCLPLRSLKDLMAGGYRKVTEAGAFLVGGHSVEDQEPKYGLCVFGETETDSLWKVTGARPGDSLILTKPLGAGIVATAIKADMAEDPRWASQAIGWMRTLNDLPVKMSPEERRKIHGCTDVTGFGLAGHILDMLSEKKLDLNLKIDNLPVMEGALELAALGLIPAGAYANQNLYKKRIFNPDMAGDRLDLLFDPQTSGGLLMAVPKDFCGEMIETAKNHGFTMAAEIGTFTEGCGKILIS